jgi:uncharacterized protein
MAEEPLLTAAPIISEPPQRIPTGNLVVALPTIQRADGGIYRAGVLHMGARAQLDLVGDEAARRPLLCPFLERGGARLPFGELSWSRDAFWLPKFRARADGLNVTGTIFAPIDEHGFVYLLEVSGTTPAEPIVVGIEGWWDGVEATIFEMRRIQASIELWHDDWTGTLVGEARTGLPLLAWGVQPSVPGEVVIDGLHYLWRCELDAAGGPARVAFYVGVNLEADGARTTSLHLRRRGSDQLLKETQQWLLARALPVESPARQVLNENLFFSYFFGQADSIDGDEAVFVTSRSSDYYVSAAFWARDAFLWVLPAVLLVDRSRARRLLLEGLGRYAPRAGEHALYITGTILYPGFELDEACAPIIGLDNYVELTGDVETADLAEIREALQTLEESILKRHDPQIGMYSTFLSPHDDPVTRPFLTYNNVLVWRCLRVLGRLRARYGDVGRGEELKRHADDLAQTIRDRCVVPGPFGPQYAWAIDATGGFELDEQPGGSLSLLARYGFCSSSEPAYQNTLRWMRSKHNRYSFDGPFGGLGSVHFPFPSIFDLANRLALGDAEALDMACRAPLDQGLACESFDPQTGEVRTGAAFAAGAGLLANAIYEHLGAGASS